MPTSTPCFKSRKRAMETHLAWELARSATMACWCSARCVDVCVCACLSVPGLCLDAHVHPCTHAHTYTSARSLAETPHWLQALSSPACELAVHQKGVLDGDFSEHDVAKRDRQHQVTNCIPRPSPPDPDVLHTGTHGFLCVVNLLPRTGARRE
jgi:hypothetical protein